MQTTLSNEQLDELLKLDNQLCFPLYACAKEIVRRYRPILDELGLTYTQYITMMVLWEHKSLSVSELGQRLFLDSGTLTPLLKKMERKGLVSRTRSTVDERMVLVEITEEGERLKEQAREVPLRIASCVNLDAEDAVKLKELLGKALDAMAGQGRD